MNDLTDIYKNNKEGLNPNLVFLLREWERYKILALQGSTRSGKTYSIVDFIIWLVENYNGLIISVVRATLPSLKTSILRDFKDEMLRFNMWTDANFNKTELEYRHNGNIIEFFSVDDEQKVRGRKRQVLICNEANEIPQDRMMQLLLRTEGFAIMDYNPSMTESHVYDILERDDCAMIITTYKDNPHLSPAIIEEIERLKDTDENLWKIYGCGIRGEDRAGVIYTRWNKTENIPSDLPFWYGVDFGFTNDPTAIIKIFYNKKERLIYLKEVAYEKGLMNSDIANIIKQDIRQTKVSIYEDLYIQGGKIFRDKEIAIDDLQGEMREVVSRELEKIEKLYIPIYCDSAEPKSIVELRQHGLSTYPAIKGGGSVASQILYLFNFRILYDGVNIDNERKKYKWKERRLGDNFDNVPLDAYNHAMDAARYGIYTHLVREG
ncbi:MAG: hypothetical protein EOM67_10180 [Spirochaetia bacterium]|nr:hypothetical protein [Spirochaetia bacterium]